jgi:hypothetical protein
VPSEQAEGRLAAAGAIPPAARRGIVSVLLPAAVAGEAALALGARIAG